MSEEGSTDYSRFIEDLRDNATSTGTYEREHAYGALNHSETSTSTEEITTSGLGNLSLDISFTSNASEPALIIRENGDFIVNGKKVTNDLSVYKAMKRWCAHMDVGAVDADGLESILKSKDYKRFYRNNHGKGKQPGQTFIDYIRKRQDA